MGDCEYRTEKTLGSGTFGKVNLVKDLRNNKNYAIKLFADGIETSMREIDILFRIRNKFLVKGWDIKTKNTCKYMDGNLAGIVEDLVNGDLQFNDNVNIFDKLKIRPTLINKIAIFEKLLHEICSATNCLAENGYYHVDIKPENLFYEYTESNIGFFLGDYGLCEPCDRIGEPQKIEVLTGSSFYFAPEMILNFKNKEKYIYPSTSSWQIALSIFEILVGKKSFNYWNQKIAGEFNHYIKVIFSDKINRDQVLDRNEIVYNEGIDSFLRNWSRDLDEFFNLEELRENSTLFKKYHSLKYCLEKMLIKNPLERFTPERVLQHLDLPKDECLAFPLAKIKKDEIELVRYFYLILDEEIDNIYRQDSIKLRVKHRTLAFHYICQLLFYPSKDKKYQKRRDALLSGNIGKIRQAIRECLYTATIFDLQYIPEEFNIKDETILEVIKELNCYLYVNKIYQNLSQKNIAEFFDYLKSYDPVKWKKFVDIYNENFAL